MKKLGILIGTEDEPISKKYYQKNKSSLKILQEYDYLLDYIPYDAAIFAEIHSQGLKKDIEVIPLFGTDLTLEDCNECSSIFCIFEGVYAFMNGKQDGYKQYMNILKKTKANVYPSQKMQQFIINKHQYMNYLHKKGYKIAPTSFINLKHINLKKVMKFIDTNEYNTVIVKPELGAFKSGFKKIHNPTQKKISDNLQRLKKQGYQHILLQPFLDEFNKFGEIKTYWVGGKNIYSYRQQWEDGEGVFQNQDKIDKQLLNDCLQTGKKVLQDLCKDHETLVQCRIDFACCVNNNNHCREFFINEIEICPTIGEQESDGKAYKLLAKQVLKQCL